MGRWAHLAPELARALWFRTWASFFCGAGYLAFSEQLASWLGFHLLPPLAILIGAFVMWALCRGLGAAAARRWRAQTGTRVFEVVLQRREVEDQRGQ